MAAVELFEFLADGTYYRYTSGDVAVVKDAETFSPVAISRSNLAHTEDLNRTRLSITAMRDNPFVVAALASPQPADITTYGELTGSTWSTIWKGRVINISLHGAQADIETESLLTLLNRNALVKKYQILCPYALYGQGANGDCKVTAATYKYTGSVSVVDGVTVTIPGLNGETDGYYNGGYVKFGTYDFRTIVTHIGDVITIYSAVSGLAVSTSADVYPGCDHSETDCNTKFSNLANYGGFPYMPSGRTPLATPKPKKRRR